MLVTPNLLWRGKFGTVQPSSRATPLGTRSDPQPLKRSPSAWLIRLSSLAVPLSMPRKPQPLSGRAARCAPHPARSLRSLAGIAVLASQGVPRSGCPFQSHPGAVAGRRARRLVRGRRSPAGRRAVRGGRRARATRAREAGAEAVRSRRRPRLGRVEACGSWAVLSRSRSWRTERAMAGRAEGESLSRPLSAPGGAERRGYVAQRPRAAEGFLGVCGAAQCSSGCTCAFGL